MRIHRNYDQFQVWSNVPELPEFVRAGNIVAARLEPIIRQMLPHTTLDLVFGLQQHYLTVPLIIVDAAQVVLREADRLIWPAAVAERIDDRDAFEIEQALMPWLRSMTLSRALDTEQIRHFGNEADRQYFEGARSAQCIGAAPLGDVVRALGPYVFGARYAAGKRVLIAGANDGVQGGAFLARYARAIVTQDLEPAQTDLGKRWFYEQSAEPAPGPHQVLFLGGSAEFTSPPHGASPDAVVFRLDPAHVVTGERQICATAYPLDVLFDYDELHGPANRVFSVEVREQSIGGRPAGTATYRVRGEPSGGRILFGLRRDWESAPDSDSDSALELARLLRTEGLHVDISTEPSTCDFESYDIVHCFNLVEAAPIAAFLAAGKQAGVRTVLTANFTDISGGLRTWGVQTAPICFTQEIDETPIQSYLSFFERRALLAPGWDEEARRGPIPRYDEMVSGTLGLCDVVLAESSLEGDVLRHFGFQGDLRIMAPFLPAASATMAVPPVGFERFAFIHAPLEPRNNQLFAVRAAIQAGIPLVCVGGVRDMAYAARIREVADGRVAIVSATEAQLQWLYAHAETILDPSWYSFGTSRLCRAILSGAKTVASSSGWGPSLWPDLLSVVDPASIQSLASGLEPAQAPSRAAREALARTLDPGPLLRNVLRAYVGQPQELAAT